MQILYEDDYIIAVNKPHGLLVHKTNLAIDAKEFALQKLSAQIGKQVHPAHRLDRKTSGVLLFTFNREENGKFQRLFREKEIEKTYLAIVRGYTEEDGTIDYALTNVDGKTQEAVTHYQTLKRTEVDIPLGKHPTSRYSLVEVTPETGRMHQIRKHFAHLRHPIIGDRKHGCNKQNRFFKQQWNMTTMLLHAQKLAFIHPITQKKIEITAPLHEEFNRVLEFLQFKGE